MTIDLVGIALGLLSVVVGLVTGNFTTLAIGVVTTLVFAYYYRQRKGKAGPPDE